MTQQFLFRTKSSHAYIDSSHKITYSTYCSRIALVASGSLLIAGNGNRARARQAGALPWLEAAVARFPSSVEIQEKGNDALTKIKAGG
jgi:hypothetical protein